MRQFKFTNVLTSARQRFWRGLALGAFSLAVVAAVLLRATQAPVDLRQFAPADAVAYLELSAPALGYPGPSLPQLLDHPWVRPFTPQLAELVRADAALQRIGLVWSDIDQPPTVFVQVAAWRRPRDPRWQVVQARVYVFGEGRAVSRQALSLRDQVDLGGDCCHTVVAYLSTRALAQLRVDTDSVHLGAPLPMPTWTQPLNLVADWRPGRWTFSATPLGSREDVPAVATPQPTPVLLTPDASFSVLAHDVSSQLVAAWLAGISRSPHDLADALAVRLPQLGGESRYDLAVSQTTPSSTPTFVLAWQSSTLPAGWDATFNTVAQQLHSIQRSLVLPDGSIATEIVGDPLSVRWQSIPGVPSGRLAQGSESLAVVHLGQIAALSNHLDTVRRALVPPASTHPNIACAPRSGPWLLLQAGVLKDLLTHWGLVDLPNARLLLAPTDAGGVAGCWQ